MFRRSRPKAFEYQPRYWDEDRERLEERRRAILEESNPDPENHTFRPSFRKAMIMDHPSHETRAEGIRRANRRVLVIMAVLFIIAYFLLNI